MTGYSDAAPRPLTPMDAEAARALVLAALGGTPYVDRVLELLADAERGDPESRLLLVEHDGDVAGLALYGPVAGTQNAWRIMTLLLSADAEPRATGRDLVAGVVDAATNAGGRLLTTELPADPAIGPSLTVLRANGFRQEGRIPDFFRQDVALLFLRRDL